MGMFSQMYVQPERERERRERERESACEYEACFHTISCNVWETETERERERERERVWETGLISNELKPEG